MTVSVTEVRSTSQLLEFIGGGGQPKYLFFWGHQPQPDCSVGKGCFSQWWPAEFTVAGVAYPSAEHFMMTAKALLFGDAEMAKKIPAAGHPREAKALGRQVRGFDEELWAQRRFDLVVAGNVAKFGQNPDLRDYLLATGDRVLVEASPPDRVWGIGMAASDELATFPEHWRGLNLLGFALMEARHQLRQRQVMPADGRLAAQAGRVGQSSKSYARTIALAIAWRTPAVSCAST
jgi:ribA/ribD-fused uncharacterized protein